MPKRRSSYTTPAALLLVVILATAARAERPAGFASWQEAFQGPAAGHFGIAADGKPRHTESHYTLNTPKPDDLSFDVSNNRILCSVSRTGQLRNACIATGVTKVPQDHRTLRGTTAQKTLVDGGPWSIAVQWGSKPSVPLHELPGVEADLADAFFPRFSYHFDGSRARLLVFAPVDAGAQTVPPSALIGTLLLENTSAAETRAVIKLAGKRLGPATAAGARATAVGLDGQAWSEGFGQLALTIGPGKSVAVPLAFVLGENAESLQATVAALQKRPSLDWFNATRAYHRARLGELTIADAPYYAESLVRLAELCRQSSLVTANGKAAGTLLGSDFHGAADWHSTMIWNKDTFYPALAMSLFEPRQCAETALFLLQWAMPEKPFGRGVKRFPAAPAATHSLSNTLAPLVLAGAYYQMTGDTQFFKDHPELLRAAKERFQAILDSRTDKNVFLFPSMYVSDGDARGDWHTGSNVLVWYSLVAMSRLARDAWGDEAASARWAELARSVQADLLRRCAGDGPRGRRFFEGANRDGTFVPGHDGEESDTGLMPFYGFCQPDDPALLTHQQLALSDKNPLYARAVDGIWWRDDPQWHPATFPAWTTALSGAGSEQELRARLQQIARLTDHDGSIWWWPYKYKETDPKAVMRTNGAAKCSWAAGVYVCQFINNILGLRVDVPGRRVDLRPMMPWNRFAWKTCRLGSSLWDVRYERAAGQISCELTNRNPWPCAATVELMLAPGRQPGVCRVNGKQVAAIQARQRYGRPAVRIEQSLDSTQTLRVEVHEQKPD